MEIKGAITKFKKVFAVEGYEIKRARVDIINTIDRRVRLLLIFGEDFGWSNRKDTEASRCKRCKAFIIPKEIHPCLGE